VCHSESRLTTVDCNYERPRYDDFKNYKTEPLLSCRSRKIQKGGNAKVERTIDTRGFITPLEVIATRFAIAKIAAVLSLLRTIKDDDTFEEWAVLPSGRRRTRQGNVRRTSPLSPCTPHPLHHCWFPVNGTHSQLQILIRIPSPLTFKKCEILATHS
jgi:hypothetical protein